MDFFNLNECKLTDGFFYDIQKINADVTMRSVYARFKETGRFDALKCKKTEERSHRFWDSDVAKWLEAAAYLLSADDDEEIRAWYDEAVKDICDNQLENGYFNSYFQVYEPENIFANRDGHELYCAGHLFEAAVAAKQYLNDGRLLRFSEKYIDHIYERFVEKKDTAFTTPGHEEIELALCRLYSLTGKEKCKALSKFFIDMRGTETEQNVFSEADYCQSDLPVREQTEARGHAVRALYLYTAMADMARLTGDTKLKKACEALFDNIATKKMYITGATGSSYAGERFTNAYDLPNERAYAETCAAIALVFFCDRMLRLTGEAKYGHVLERTLYNGVLAGVSLDGASFFYTNPLEVSAEKIRYNRTQGARGRDRLPIIERVKVFNCSCCPPNICRFFEEIPSYIWYADEENRELLLSQFISSELHTEFCDASVNSDFPKSGALRVKINSHGKKIRFKIRVPEWCDRVFEDQKDGYIVIERVFENEEVSIDFPMALRKVYANPLVDADAGKVALSYGPIILCAEGIDNDMPLSSVRVGGISKAKISILNGQRELLEVVLPIDYLRSSTDLYSYKKSETARGKLRLHPYYAWANRGETDMKVWFVEK